jgi:hypothetical protein
VAQLDRAATRWRRSRRALVQEAWQIGQRAGLDPTLILAIMAVESSFNPFAQSPVGAQGLMQVMTRVHDDKYEAFGGVHAAFDPVSNLRVGVQVLKDCIASAPAACRPGCATTSAPPARQRRRLRRPRCCRAEPPARRGRRPPVPVNVPQHAAAPAPEAAPDSWPARAAGRPPGLA